MKLLLIFVSALAVVVHAAQAVSADDAEQVHVVDIPKEVRATAIDINTVQERGSVEPQSVFVEHRNDPAVRVFGAEEEQRAGSPLAEDDAGSESELPESIDVQSITRRCTNSACASKCRSLGFRRGVCVSATTCRCYR